MKFEMSTSSQYHYEDLNVILYDPKHLLIIEVDLNKIMNKILERCHYYPRKDNRRILESKGHNFVLKTSPLHRKGCLVSIFLCDYDLMVAREPIGKRIKFLTPNTFEYLIHKLSREHIM